VTKVSFGVLAIIQNGEGRCLLVRTIYGGSLWRLPGGFVEEGESPIEALRRELREELSVEIEVIRFVGVYYKIYERNLNLVFLCKITRGQPRPDQTEVCEFNYFDLHSLPEGLSGRARVILEDCHSGISDPLIWAFRSPNELG